jgi:hypothetical protein
MHPLRFIRWLGIAMLMVVLAAPLSAYGQDEQGDYGGTYGGTATTSKGFTLPIVVYVEDGGEKMNLRVVVKGYPVPFSAEESWSSTGSVTITPSLNSRMVKGSGMATFSQSGSKWLATGSGSGSVYNLFKLVWINGSAQGSAERLSAKIDTALGDKWIEDHPEKAPAKKTRTRAAVAIAVDKAASPLAPPQLPLSEIDRYKLLFILLFFIAVSVIMSRILGKPWGMNSDSPTRSDLDEIQPDQGGATK